MNNFNFVNVHVAKSKKEIKTSGDVDWSGKAKLKQLIEWTKQFEAREIVFNFLNSNPKQVFLLTANNGKYFETWTPETEKHKIALFECEIICANYLCEKNRITINVVLESEILMQ